jgi:hypothetical protein
MKARMFSPEMVLLLLTLPSDWVKADDIRQMSPQTVRHSASLQGYSFLTHARPPPF